MDMVCFVDNRAEQPYDRQCNRHDTAHRCWTTHVGSSASRDCAQGLWWHRRVLADHPYDVQRADERHEMRQQRVGGRLQPLLQGAQRMCRHSLFSNLKEPPLAWTRNTSSASTGLYDPAPPARKGLAVALVSVFATSRPTVACMQGRLSAPLLRAAHHHAAQQQHTCRPSSVAAMPRMLIQQPFCSV